MIEGYPLQTNSGLLTRTPKPAAMRGCEIPREMIVSELRGGSFLFPGGSRSGMA